MKRTTIFADDETMRRLAGIARLRGVTLSEVIREALDSYASWRREGPTLPSFVGIGASGRSDISEHAEELLWRRGKADQDNEESA